MSGSTSGRDPKQAKERFVEAASGEQRLRASAGREREDERKWRERAALALERGRPELAAEAEAQAASHGRKAELYEAELAGLGAEVEHLRQVARNPELGAAPDPQRIALASEADVAAHQLDEMEKEDRIQQDLTALKAKMGKLPPSGAAQPDPADAGPGS